MGNCKANGAVTVNDAIVIAKDLTATSVGRIYIGKAGVQIGALSGIPKIILSTGTFWQAGAGSPEGIYAAPVVSQYTRTDGSAGTTIYIKEGGGSGTRGWVAK